MVAVDTEDPRIAARRRALLRCVVLLAATTVLVNRVLPDWAYAIWNTGATVALVGLARRGGVDWPAAGLDRRRLGRMVAFALIGALGVAVVYGLGWLIPATRSAFHDSRADAGTVAALLYVVLVRIPFGTVLLEEVAFRGVLPALFGGDERWRWRPVLAASGLFGLWHLIPSMRLATTNAAVHQLFGDSATMVVSLVAMTAAALSGIAMCAWRYAGRGVIASMGIHVATNSGGYAIAWLLLH